MLTICGVRAPGDRVRVDTKRISRKDSNRFVLNAKGNLGQSIHKRNLLVTSPCALAARADILVSLGRLPNWERPHAPTNPKNSQGRKVMLEHRRSAKGRMVIWVMRSVFLPLYSFSRLFHPFCTLAEKPDQDSELSSIESD